MRRDVLSEPFCVVKGFVKTAISYLEHRSRTRQRLQAEGSWWAALRFGCKRETGSLVLAGSYNSGNIIGMGAAHLHLHGVFLFASTNRERWGVAQELII